MKVLIVKTSSMGDVVHALPVVHDIRQAMPGARIEWLVESTYAAIPRMHPGVAELAGLKKLKLLDLRGCLITNEALKIVDQLPALVSLKCRSSAITNDVVENPSPARTNAS